MMRIERDKPIYDGWAALLTDEVRDEKDPLLKTAIEMLGTDDLILNVTNGRTYIYRRAG